MDWRFLCVCVGCSLDDLDAHLLPITGPSPSACPTKNTRLCLVIRLRVQFEEAACKLGDAIAKQRCIRGLVANLILVVDA